MNKYFLLPSLAALTMFAACSKDKKETPTEDFNTTKTAVIDNFADNIATATYGDLHAAAVNLNSSVKTLAANATDANLNAARSNWRAMRAIWEQSEGFLFGPVEDNEYDPQMDTWPTDYNQMDSLLSSSNSLSVTEIANIGRTLRGYHPLEYILFGADGKRVASSISARETTYMLSLGQDLENICSALHTAWISNPVNFSGAVKTAGNGSAVFTKKQELFIALVDGMAGICEEVGTGKMFEPYFAYDSSIVESPYSGTSMTDFRNNIVGLQNVYLGRYNGKQGKGLKELVSAKNISLDNKIQAQISEAIAALDNVTVPFEEAIFTQRVQLKNAMDKLETLHDTLEDELNPFVKQYITD